MTFKWPEALILLVLVAVLAGLYVWMQQRRRRYALRYASVALVAQAVGRGPGIRRHIPAALYLTALTALVIALARPQATIPVPQNTGTIILSIDVSGSMFAQDVEPNRMEATKAAVREFVKKQPRGVKIGIVSFSDYAALVAAPSRERGEVLDALARLRPQRGTNIGSGLQVALDAIREETGDAPTEAPLSPNEPTPTPAPGSDPPPASIVLLSDGQSNVGPDPLEVAKAAAAAGIKVYTIGIGTPEGTVLVIQGRSVYTRLDESTLQSVAEQTGGRYFSAQDEEGLRQIYDELSRERELEEEETEVTFAFAAGALIISVLAGGLGLLWFNRLP
ncbi:MAG TPA: VWA domain-containing protein [Dehalococcoidia bacterium]